MLANFFLTGLNARVKLNMTVQRVVVFKSSGLHCVMMLDGARKTLETVL